MICTRRLSPVSGLSPRWRAAVQRLGAFGAVVVEKERRRWREREREREREKARERARKIKFMGPIACISCRCRSYSLCGGFFQVLLTRSSSDTRCHSHPCDDPWVLLLYFVSRDSQA